MGTIIVDVKIAKFDGPIDVIWRSMKELDAYWIAGPDEERERVQVTEHVIKQRCFVTAKGKKVYLGATPDVEEAIGLPFESFTNMEKDLSDMHSIIVAQTSKIRKLNVFKKKVQSMNFLDRLMFLFIGADL